MLNCVGVAGKGERVMCFIEGQGVDEHRGDDFFCVVLCLSSSTMVSNGVDTM